MEALTLHYDNCHRLEYHPEFHPRQGEKWTHEELEYLCKFIEHDGPASMAMALGRTQTTVASRVTVLKKRGLYNYYKDREKYYLRVRG